MTTFDDPFEGIQDSRVRKNSTNNNHLTMPLKFLGRMHLEPLSWAREECMGKSTNSLRE